jgi:hypothetical protein
VINWNDDMGAAPKDGTMLLLWSHGRAEVGSWRKDEGFADNSDEPLWLDNGYDDFSCGYASRPLMPTYWSHINEPSETKDT